MNLSKKDSRERSTVEGNRAVVIFDASLVKHAASALRLPANYVGVHSARQDFRNTEGDARNSKQVVALVSDVKFSVIDENGNERRMTKAEKKARKFELAQAKKEAKKKEAEARRKRKLGELTVAQTDDEVNEDTSQNVDSDGGKRYHQLPISSATMDQELAEHKGRRGSTPPVVLSPCMAFQFVKNRSTFPTNQSCTQNEFYNNTALLAYNHDLSKEWATILKERCVLPAEAVRQKEDLRPLAYRLQPEPWQRLRPSLEEKCLKTFDRRQPIQRQPNDEKKIEQPLDHGPKSSDWIPLECRPPCPPDTPISSGTGQIPHDEILSVVFEYIYRETPFHVSCGAKFGSDFLIYDGPREERHAFAGLRVLSHATNSMITLSATVSTETCGINASLPLPTAYSLTGFVRCLNTAGKLALLATADEVWEVEDNEKLIERCSGGKTKKYRVAFVDVALEKVLDVHRQKNRGRSTNKKLEKRRDVTQTLSKK